VRKLAVAIADSKVRYDDIAAVLDAFMSLTGVKYKLERAEHASFIQGRVARILVRGKEIGIIGEIRPEVLENWKLEMPVAAFEIEVENLI
jgi:phenylalanyl-tRNA synthetase beta chain